MNNPKRKPRYTAEIILRLLKQHRSELVQFGVRKIGLFGSYRRGNPHSESDMDFLVVFEKPTFDGYMDVKIFLEDLFGCKVDLVLEDSIKPRLRSHILSEVVYAQGY
jgi:uncharacterized protein